MKILGKQPYSIFEVSNRYERKVREVRLHCENGIAVLKNEKVDYVELIHGDATSKPDKTKIEQRSFERIAPLQKELEEFLSFLDGGPAPRSSFEDGLEVIKTIHDLQELAKQSI